MYTIIVRIGNIENAGTDSKIKVQLWNKSNKHTGTYILVYHYELNCNNTLLLIDWIQLTHCKTHPLDPFEVFKMEAKDIGDKLQSIKFLSDGSGTQPDWYLT